jgi:hypothetical protein
LRQLEQYFYNDDGNDEFDCDWNGHGRYYATTSMLKASPLANINMAKADGIKTPVSDVSFFEPTHGEQEYSNHTIKKSYVMLNRGVKKTNNGSTVPTKL